MRTILLSTFAVLTMLALPASAEEEKNEQRLCRDVEWFGILEGTVCPTGTHQRTNDPRGNPTIEPPARDPEPPRCPRAQ